MVKLRFLGSIVPSTQRDYGRGIPLPSAPFSRLIDLYMIYFVTQQSPTIYGPSIANNNLVLRLETSMKGDKDYCVCVFLDALHAYYQSYY